jgi:hypothetical protein
MEIRTQCNEVAPTWSDCCGIFGFTEWRVWVNGALVIDEIGTGYGCFDNESDAISTAQWIVKNDDNKGI